MDTVRDVLVVDDDAGLRELVTLVLESHGIGTRTCLDGASALDVARETRPDLVVLDVMLPETDGIAVLQQLKADPVTAHIPVVLLTALGDDADVWRGWEAGADYYLTKPFEVEELLHYVRYLSKGTRWSAV
jgi:DNA-binding response OmpR family regulator